MASAGTRGGSGGVSCPRWRRPGFRAIAPQPARCRRDGSKRRAAYTTELYAQDLEAFLAALGITRRACRGLLHGCVDRRGACRPVGPRLGADAGLRRAARDRGRTGAGWRRCWPAPRATWSFGLRRRTAEAIFSPRLGGREPRCRRGLQGIGARRMNQSALFPRLPLGLWCGLPCDGARGGVAGAGHRGRCGCVL